MLKFCAEPLSVKFWFDGNKFPSPSYTIAYLSEDKDTALAFEPLAPFIPSTPILDTAKSNLTFLPVT